MSRFQTYHHRLLTWVWTCTEQTFALTNVNRNKFSLQMYFAMISICHFELSKRFILTMFGNGFIQTFSTWPAVIHMITEWPEGLCRTFVDLQLSWRGQAFCLHGFLLFSMPLRILQITEAHAHFLFKLHKQNCRSALPDTTGRVAYISNQNSPMCSTGQQQTSIKVTQNFRGCPSKKKIVRALFRSKLPQTIYQ